MCWEPAPGEKKQRGWMTPFANFCGVNTPAVADFKLPAWVGKTPARLTICGSQWGKKKRKTLIPAYLACAEPLHLPFSEMT